MYSLARWPGLVNGQLKEVKYCELDTFAIGKSLAGACPGRKDIAEKGKQKRKRRLPAEFQTSKKL